MAVKLVSQKKNSKIDLNHFKLTNLKPLFIQKCHPINQGNQTNKVNPRKIKLHNNFSFFVTNLFREKKIQGIVMGGRLSTFDLLIKVACFIKRQIITSMKNELILTSWYKEVNHTEPSPSVKTSMMSSFNHYTDKIIN